MKGENFHPDIIQNLTLPPVELKICRRNDVYKVFDPLRKNYFILTNEEFVRQSFVAWLIKDLGYPKSLMANEIGIRLNNLYKRCDTVVFSNSGTPLMIIEYKSPTVAITQEVFDQIVRYNMVLNAKFLTVSNGINHYCCQIDSANNGYHFLSEFPSYEFLKSYDN